MAGSRANHLSPLATGRTTRDTLSPMVRSASTISRSRCGVSRATGTDALIASCAGRAVAQRHREAAQPRGVLLVVGGVAAHPHVVERLVEGGAVGDRVGGQRSSASAGMCSSRSAPNRSASSALPSAVAYAGSRRPTRLDVRVVLLGLPGGQVHDVGAVEPAEVERLVEVGAQIVEERRDQRQVRVAVEVARADEQRADADAVQRARRRRTAPSPARRACAAGRGRCCAACRARR